MFKQSKTHITSLVLFVIIATFILQNAEATATNFTVHGGEEITKQISLTVDDHVLIRFSVVGAPDNTLNFSIVYPNGTVQNFGLIGDFHHSFICDSDGTCILHFSNMHSIEEKFVALDYEVEHYILGIPQMLFLTVIIAILCVAAVAVFILMGKPH